MAWSASLGATELSNPFLTRKDRPFSTRYLKVDTREGFGLGSMGGWSFLYGYATAGPHSTGARRDQNLPDVSDTSEFMALTR